MKGLTVLKDRYISNSIPFVSGPIDDPGVLCMLKRSSRRWTHDAFLIALVPLGLESKPGVFYATR